MVKKRKMKSDLENKFYLFLLTQITGLGINTIWTLLKKYKSSKLLYISIIKEETNIPDRVIYLVKKEINKRFIEKFKKDFLNIEEPFICILDKEYPDLLKNIYDPPLFIYYRGNIDLLRDKLITVIGSRKITKYHKNSLIEITKDWNNIVVVSGLALGIDSLSHRIALDKKLKTIAVLGSGLDEIYPKININLSKEIIKNNGLLISEYSKNTKPSRYTFPKRNRILAGLSEVIVVVSGGLKSGTLITAQVALEEGREVYALKSNINFDLNKGPNLLIREGASKILLK